MRRLCFILFVTARAAATAQDYEALGIPLGSDMERVKSAYRQEALKWHPDRNSDPDATMRFREISDAYARIKSTGANSGDQIDPFKMFNEFMGSSFSFSFNAGGGATVSGTSQSSSTVIQNGRRITKTTKTDLSSGMTETTVTEEDMQTGVKQVRHQINGRSIEL